MRAGLLASPELVAGHITAVRRENGAAENTQLAEGDVIEALAALEPVWDELFSAEQARILQLLVARVTVRLDGLEISLRVEGITSVIEDLGLRVGTERQAA